MNNPTYKSATSFSSFSPTSNHVGTTDSEKKQTKIIIIVAVTLIVLIIFLAIAFVKANSKRNTFFNEPGIIQE